MNRSSLLSRLFAISPRWRRIAVWAALFSTTAGTGARAQPPANPALADPMATAAYSEMGQAAPQNAYVLTPDASGALIDRTAGADDLGVGGMGILGRMGHIAGETVGRTQSITHFELMPYLFEDKTMFYGDGRLYATNNGRWGGTGGGGIRHFVDNWNAVLGVGGFYDADDTRNISFQQVGLSLEYLSEWVDVRSNLYQSTGRDAANLGTSLVRGSERFVDTHIEFDSRTKLAAAADGLDMLFTVPVAGELAQAANLEASAGWYTFQARGKDLPHATGYRLRLDADWMENLLHTFVEFTSDKVFDNNVIFGADLNYYHDVQRRPRIGHSQFNRMAEFVRRNYNVVTIDQSALNPPSVAVNPTSGTPYVVLHVRNIVPPNPAFPNFPAGTGTPDNPYPTIDQAQADPRNADIIFVHSGSVFVAQPVVFDRPDLQILGEGVVHPIAVTNAPFARARPFDPLGTIPLPTVTGGTILPQLVDNITDAVTFTAAADRDVFAGFDVINTTGTAIQATSVNTFTIRDVNIDGTNGATSHGLSFNNVRGAVRIEDVTVTGVGGDSFLDDGGDAIVNWFGGSITSTAHHSVLIQNQTAGVVNLAGDNGTNSASTFGGVTITDTGGEGIVIQDTSADVAFGRWAQSSAGTPGITITNSTSNGMLIDNVTNPGSVSILRGMSINNAALASLEIDDFDGNFLLANDAGLASDLLIRNRNATGIELSNIDAPGSVQFAGDVDLGSINISSPAATTDPAVQFHRDSTGLVQFDGDLFIGDPAGPGSVNLNVGASVNAAIAIDGAIVNADGARFQANGDVTIVNTLNGPAISMTNGPTDVQFGRSINPGTVIINPLLGQALLIDSTTGVIRFNSPVDIRTSVSTAVDIENNEGQITFRSVFVENSVSPPPVAPASPAPAVLIQNNRNAAGNASVAFQTLDIIESGGGFALIGQDNDSLSSSGGSIGSIGGPAIDLVDNDKLNWTVNSVEATGYAPLPFGVRVMDTRFTPNPNAVFRISGSASSQAILPTGTISSGIVAGDGIASRGAVFQNIQTVSISDQQFIDNDGLAINALNVVNFTLSTVNTSDRTFFSNNGTDEPAGTQAHVRLAANTTLTGSQQYNWIINDSVFEDTVQLATNDAMVQIVSLAGASGEALKLTLDENQVRDTTTGVPIVPGFTARRTLTNSAAVRVDWTGDLDATFTNNWIELDGPLDGTIGLDVRQRGSTADSTVVYGGGNQIRATDTTSTGMTGIRMRFEAPTDLTVFNNLIPLPNNAAPLPGFLFNGFNATAMDLTFQAAGNNILIDDNIINITGDGGTGILFRQINTSNVTIGAANIGTQPFGNSIDLTDSLGTVERGIIFQTTFGTINLFGNDDNIITLNQNIGGPFIDFQQPAVSNGQILINGVPRP